MVTLFLTFNNTYVTTALCYVTTTSYQCHILVVYKYLLILYLYYREAGCTPFAAVIIGEMFAPELRGSAMGIYNFGIYFGYSLSYAFGNFLYNANIMGEVSNCWFLVLTEMRVLSDKLTGISNNI